MNDNETSNSTKKEPVSPNLTPVEKRLALLKAEVNLDFPNLVQQLESGSNLVLVKAREFTNTMDPDVLRRLGGMIALCHHYRATVIVANDEKIAEFYNEEPASK